MSSNTASTTTTANTTSTTNTQGGNETKQDGGFNRGFGRGRGRREGGRGRDGGGDKRGDRRGGRGGRGRGGDKEEWTPVTKLGRLVKDGKISSLEQIFTHALPIKEFQIVDHFLGKEVLKDEVMKICPVQKQTAAGQRTKFKAWVIVGDGNGHVGVGVKCAKEVAGAIRGALIGAKMAIVPLRRGYWGGRFGSAHTVPVKVTGKCGSVRVRLVPAPRGTGIVAARVPKKVLTFAGIKDVYTQTKGSTKTVGNALFATYHALQDTYRFLTPDQWKHTVTENTPFQTFSEHLANTKKDHFVKSQSTR